MKTFYSCDWGTSSFRLRLVDADNLFVLSEIKTTQGIAATYQAWQQAGAKENNRMSFFQSYLLEQVQQIADSFKFDIAASPVVLSGMASSSIGMIEIPYKELPIQCNGRDLPVHILPKNPDQPYELLFIPGVCSGIDAMRGEETILVGCDIENSNEEQLFIFPGTHSKHVAVIGGEVKKITTYMTGEVFDLLSNKSILAASVTKSNLAENVRNLFFMKGVTEGASSNILNSLFHVRTNQLFKKSGAEENYHYLSGLLIGQELKEIVSGSVMPVTLVCGPELKRAYMEAMDILGLSKQVYYKNADEAFVNGQRAVLLQKG